MRAATAVPYTRAMSAPETFQIPLEVAEIYESKFVPALFADWAPHVVDMGDVTTGHSVLDVACGTGMHLGQLRAWYTVEGVDVERRLLDMARQRLPGVPFHSADMRDFTLDRYFDVVTCLFSSIGYMQTLVDLHRAVANMAAHLTPGGVLVVEPWLSPDSFTPGHIGGPLIGEAPDLKVVRMNDSRVEGRLSVMEFHYLIGRPGGIEHLRETHALGLFSADEYSNAFARAGLVVEHDPEGLIGRGLWIGVRPAA